LFASRAAGIGAVDGPLLTIADDDALHQSSSEAAALGFDGKWVIHPGQVATVQQAFSPSEQEINEAREIIAVMHTAAIQNRGALQWRGRMLDEAVTARARRILERAVSQ
jgi:citrate lyase subunit beta/citryl-CoA lyase